MYFDVEDIETFDKLTKESKICVVDFYANWCGPCKKLGPELQKAVTENATICAQVTTDLDDIKGKIVFIKINIDKFEELAKSFKITSIPQISFYYNGELLLTKFLGIKISETIKTIENLMNGVTVN
jgi:thioredoxin-like negative regulator of GroEL